MDHLTPAMRSLLGDALRLPSVSGAEGPFTRFIADYLRAAGLRVDLWQSTEADLAGHAVARHLPLADRPTLVATLPGTGGGRSLLFNAHADTVVAPFPERWAHPPFAGVEHDGRFYGRGACDVKGPLVSAIWALLAMRDDPPAGDVSIELVPGEEDCVTLGTLTSVVRGHTADACIVLEPTECQPRNASRPGLRFEITCRGIAVHGTVKWLGRDAITLATAVFQALRQMEAEWNDRTADPLFAPYPFARPITVDTLRGGQWQGMLCDHCLVAGYLELLPADDVQAWQGHFRFCLTSHLAAGGWPIDDVSIEFPETYPGHRTESDISLCQMASAAVEATASIANNASPSWSGWSAFNSGCEAGLRANLLGTPTLVWGPGSLAQAHAVDEFVSFTQVRAVAAQFVNFAPRVVGGRLKLLVGTPSLLGHLLAGSVTAVKRVRRMQQATSSVSQRLALGLHPAAATDESRRWFERAKAVLAGGVSSSARSTTTGPLDHPLYITHGRGSRIWDADGNQFIDYLLGYGSSILGHTDPELTEAVSRQLDLGTMFGTCNTVEVQLAEQIVRMVPCAERVRFANSGSEAIQGAVRAARGFTGRTKILKFEGHYHGWVDTLAISNRPSPDQAGPAHAPLSHPHSLGMSPAAVADVIICTWNNAAALKAILAEHDFAAVIAEPIVANNACIMPADGFLQTLREECTAHGALLIYDEIVTGFRIAPGGAQEFFGVLPDLAVYSKAIGGGLPIAAFAGRREIFELVAANVVKHGGTYNANPLCATAALHTLRTMAQPAVQDRVRQAGEAVMESIRRSAHDRGVPVIVQGAGSMFQAIFADPANPLRDYRDLARADTARYAAFRHALLEQGVHCNSSGLACWFVSAAHTADDTEIAVTAVERAMRAVS